jgi:predicted O-linked N-acetylglucosamine transferase (SPINDLY family)
MLEAVLHAAGTDAEAWYALAAVNHRLGAHAEAARCYEQFMLLVPAHPEAPYFLGNLYGESSDHERAIESYRTALRLKPAFAEAARNLGASLQALGRMREAVEFYRGFLQRSAGSADIHFNLGNALADLGAWPQAIESYRSALSIAPQRPEVHLNLGHALDESDRLDEAAGQYESVLTLDPRSVPAWRSLGSCLAEQGRTQTALECYRRGLAVEPDAGLRLRLATLLPPIPASTADLAAWRERFDRELARLEAEPPEITAPLVEGVTNFYLSYHGLDNRGLHTRMAALYARACPTLLWSAPHCAAPDARRGRLRVGFVSRYMHDHSIGRTARGLVAKLPRRNFEVTALSVHPSPDDELARFIRTHSDRFVTLPADLERARSEIAALELDVLFYQDIGMEPFTYFLAFSRLAPVQCTFFGHPDTTGIANMDYFVSSTLFEPADGAAHYSEELVALDDLGTTAYYYRPATPAPATPADFGLPTGRLYLCPQTLFKIHPEFDAIFGAILRTDPSGRVVLIEGQTRYWGELLRARFAASLPDVSDRIVFLRRQTGADFTRLLGLPCVILDTPLFNGMNTSLEAFSVGTPIVTLPGSLQRGRHTAAMYRRMGFTECIAASADDYVRVAVRLATDQDYHRHVKDEILRRSDALFEDPRVPSEFERFFLEAARRRGREP